MCDEETASLKVAGLPILDRLIVAAHRAGAAQISVVSSKPLPLLPRTTALGISFQSVADMPNIEQPTLVLSTGLLVQAADLKALVRNRGRLIGRDGVPLPAGVITEPLVRDLEEQLYQLPEVVAQGVAEPITGPSSVSAASRALWGSLASSLDGVVDKYFNRPVGHILSKQLVHTSVSPNQVSVAASLLGLLSAWLFAGGSHDAAVLGAILFQLSAILDAVDGDLARVMFKESALGKWLDVVGDQVVHVAVFVAIGVGLYRAGSTAPVVPLAASAGRARFEATRIPQQSSITKADRIHRQSRLFRPGHRSGAAGQAGLVSVDERGWCAHFLDRCAGRAENRTAAHR